MNIIKFIVFPILILISVNLYSQHHLFFYIPECPNSTNIDMDSENNISIYPNPSYDFISIEFNRSLTDVNNFKIQITNQTGQIVFNQILNNKGILNNKQIIDISKLEQGMYSVSLISDCLFITKKIIICK
jgi:hypothetical protein